MLEINVPTALEADHTQRGGRGLRRWVKHIGGSEVLRVMFGSEPRGKNDEYVGHISVSVAESLDENTPPTRLPTDDEFRIAMRVIPSKRWKEHIEPGSLVRHAWLAKDRRVK